jgi:tetratricopeptide (TPR) repeat protein
MGDRSVRAQDISKSVVVTGDGNNVALSFGDTDIQLPLRRKQFPPPDRRRRPREGEAPRQLDLLVAEAGKVPFVPRPEIFAELQAWLTDDVDLSVYALIGRAGIGKTRLALEFCRTIDNDPSADGEWIAGFLSPADLNAVVETLTTHSFKWERSTLLVIDYAAQCYQALARWLDRLAEREHEAKLRFLLLEREAPQEFGWWHELTVLGPPSRRDLFHALRPRQLPDLADLEERRSLMEAALQAARELSPGALAGVEVPAKNADPILDRRLAQSQFGNPLNLVMAGLIALERGSQAAVTLRRLDAARQIARRELRRLADLARSRQIGEDEIRHMVAFNGLTAGLPIADLRKTIVDELTTSHRSTEHLGELLSLLQQEFPPPTSAQQLHLTTIQPDLIGEAAIVEAFTGEPAREAEAPEVVRRAYQLFPDMTAEALIRLVQDFAYAVEDPNATEGEKETGHRIMSWLLDLLNAVEISDRMLPLFFKLPNQTTVLREPAAELAQRLAAYFYKTAEADNDPVKWVIVAHLVRDLANRLSALGRHEEALTAAGEAVRLRRLLFDSHPDIFASSLALSLVTLSRRMSEVGDFEGALTAAEEAVAHCRGFAATSDDDVTPSLANSIGNLSSRLSDVGRHQAAMTTGEEAVRLYRRLAASEPEEFNPELATSLNNLANRRFALGQREAAVTAAEEAVRLHRDAAGLKPDAFAPDLANSLHNLAMLQSELRRDAQAIDAGQEAVIVRRALAKSRPDAFMYPLASSLGNLSAIFARCGRQAEAVPFAEEAAQLYRRLVDTRPGVFAGPFAIVLNNLGNLLSEVGQKDKGLSITEEAVHLCRSLVNSRPGAFLPQLAASLSNLAVRLGEVGRSEEARTTIEEAIRHYRTLAQGLPNAFNVDLARSLGVLGDLYAEDGQPNLAVPEITEAIRILSPTFYGTPSAARQTMAGLIRSYAMHCEAGGWEPDRKLLRPVLAVFEKLRKEEGINERK